MIKKLKTAKKVAMGLVATCCMAMSSVALLSTDMSIKAVADNESTRHDTATVYDISEITGNNTTKYTDSAVIGQMTSNENVGVKFKLDLTNKSGNPPRAAIGFMSTDEKGEGKDDYTFVFEWDVQLVVRDQWHLGGKQVAVGGEQFSQGVYDVLITFENYYENDVRVGTLITCDVNDKTAFEYVDRSEGYASMGKYITWDELVGDAKDGNISLNTTTIATRHDTATVYDISEITGNNTTKYTDSALIGELPSNENVGVKFKLDLTNKSGNPPRAAIGFMSTDEKGEGMDDYTFVFEWDVQLVVRDQWHLGGKQVAVGGEQFSQGVYDVLITFENYYENDVRVGTLITCTVDGKTAFEYVDRSEGYASMGKYITWDELVGDAKDGNISLVSTTLVTRHDTATVYGLYELTGKDMVTFEDGVVIGEMPANENVGMKFKLDLTNRSGNPPRAVIGFMSVDENGKGMDDYTFVFEWDVQLVVREDWDLGNKFAVRGGEQFTQRIYDILITFENYYENNVRTGTLITCVVDGETVIKYVDSRLGYTWMGKYITWDEQVGDAKYSKINIKDSNIAQFTVEDIPAGVDISESFVVMLGRDEISVPVVSGIHIVDVKLNGISIADNLETTDSGYLIRTEGLTSGGVLEFEITADEGVIVNTSYTAPDAQVKMPSSVLNGGTLNISIKPNLGKEIKSVLINGVEMISRLTVSGEVYTLSIENVTEAVNVVVECQSIQYAVSVSSTGNGTAEVNVNSVMAGESVTLTVAPGQGWYVKSITCNDESIAVIEGDVYLIENKYSDMNIIVTFAKIVTVTYDEAVVYNLYDVSGTTSIQCTDSSDYLIGNLPSNNNVALKFNVTLDQTGKDHPRFAIGFMQSGYEYADSQCYTLFVDWSWKLCVRSYLEESCTASGETVMLDTKFSNVEIEFGCVKYYEDGEWVGNYIYVKVEGVLVVSFVDREEGFKTMGTGVIWNKTSRGWGDLNDKISISDLTASVITVNNVPEGVIIDEEIVVCLGKEDIKFYTEPGVIVTGITLNGESIFDALEKVAGGYKIKTEGLTVGGEIEITVLSGQVSQVTYTSPNATVTVAETVLYGDSLHIDIKPEEGKVVKSVLINGVESISEFNANGVNISADIFNIIQDVEIVVSCESETYSVTTEKTGNGNVEVSASSVDVNGKVIITVTPDEGWYIQSVTCNGKNVSINENGQATITNIISDITITVSFAQKQGNNPGNVPGGNNGGCSGSAEAFGTCAVALIAVTGAIVAKKKEED